MHNAVRKMIMDNRKVIGEDVKEESVIPNVVPPINQYDMALVQSGFIGPVLLFTKELGINCTEADIDNYVHFWRAIGWCLGISDQCNMCGDGAITARSISEEVLNQMIIPGLENPTSNFSLLSKDFEDGFSPIIPGFSRPALYYYIFPTMGLKPPKIRGRQYLFYYGLVVFLWLNYHISWFKRIVNCILHRFQDNFAQLLGYHRT